MPCYIEPHEDGEIRILCGDLGPPCSLCPASSDFLCDYPVGRGKTCDLHLCGQHGTEVAPNVHYCPGHLEEWKTFKDGGGVERELENVVPFKAL
jgi:hypothetical protein